MLKYGTKKHSGERARYREVGEKGLLCSLGISAHHNGTLTCQRVVVGGILLVLSRNLEVGELTRTVGNFLHNGSVVVTIHQTDAPVEERV